MLGAVAGDHLVVARISAQREGNLDDVVAWLHQHQDALDPLALLLQGDASLHVFDHLLLADLTGAVEEVLDHVEEARAGGGADILQPLRDLVLGGVWALLLRHLLGSGSGSRLDQGGHFLLERGALGDRLQVEHFVSQLQCPVTIK